MRRSVLGKAVLAIMTVAVIGTMLIGCESGPIVPIKKEVKAELGVEMSKNPADYVEGTNEVLAETVVDVSGVDITTLGEYEMTVTYRTEVKTLKVTVVDTIAPVAVIENEVAVLAGQPISTRKLIKKIIEYSDGTTVVLGAELYEEAGEYDNTITFKDVSGNKTEYTFHVIVFDEPVIEGLKDITVVEGSEPDYLSGVTANDGMGNDLTDSIVVNSDEVDIDTPGEYTAAYSVENKYGYGTTKTITVTVEKKPPVPPADTQSTNYPDWTGSALFQAAFDGEWFTFYYDQTDAGFSAGINSCNAIIDSQRESLVAKYPGCTSISAAGSQAVTVEVTGPYKNISPNLSGTNQMNVVKIRVPLVVSYD